MATHTDIASSSSPPPIPGWTYDVFLSFRGKDTRTNFTDHLYTALKQRGISTYRDDKKLERGKAIGPSLLKAIEESRYVIVVLSANYAHSAWCLDEVTKVVECMKLMGQTVFPVFYHVDPSDARRHTSKSFKEAFSKHEIRYKDNPEKVNRWRSALTDVANLSGWHLAEDRHESEVVQEIVGYIFKKINQTYSSGRCTELVGIDYRVNEILSYLNMDELNKVRIIGVLGMGGMGKTTIAQVVYERMRGQFEAYSFLSNVREVSEKAGLVHLQKQLLSDILFESNVNIENSSSGANIISQRLRTRKVLIILDDVKELEQLEALCGHDWFGSGSRIIITTRDEQLLRAYGIGVESIYKVKPLTDVEALQLFSWKSFKKDQVGEGFLQLANSVLNYANGLPLTIDVLGKLLYGKSAEVWSSALHRLKENPNKKIIDVLKVSFDTLELTEQRIFLDIACFFKGEDKDRVIRILESGFGYRPDIDIEVLREKSMVTLFGRKLSMHDMIQELGWEIVRREESWKHSRLWLPKDIINLLKNNEGTTEMEAIFLDSPQQEKVHLNVDPFSKMCKLRLLKINNVHLLGDIKCLSNELQLLEWHSCPLYSLPSKFQSDKLVELRMRSSCMKELWRGNKRWSMLRFIDMSDSQYLMKTPDFSEVPNLETLVLEGCIRLVEVHPSVGVLEQLILWNMGNCTSIKSLPPILRLESLATFTLSACSKLKKFPEIEGNMQSLLELHLDGTAIEELPQSFDSLIGLTLLNLGDCKSLLHLPSSIRSLKSLKRLILTGCSELRDVPDDLSCVECLEELDISGTAIRDLSGIAGMKNLKALSFRGYKNPTPKSWHSVILRCLGMEKSSDAPLSLLLPTSLSGLSSLTNLNLSGCNLMDGGIPNDLGNLVFLKILNLSGNSFVHLPESISQLSKLESLYSRNCSNLQSLPKKLPLSLRNVNAEDCQSLTDYPDQLKVWTSFASGMTIISSLISSKRQASTTSSARQISQYHTRTWIASTIPGRSIFSISQKSNEHQEWKLVDDLSLPNQVLQKDVELLDYKRSRISSGCHEDEIPEWFGNIGIGNSIGIRISPGLKDAENWMGVAVVFLVKGHPPVSKIEPGSETSNYFYKCTVGTEDFQVDPVPLDWNQYLSFITCSSHFLFFFYVPWVFFPERLNESRVMWAVFETNNPCMEVKKCGIRLLYEQGVAGFIQTYMPPAFGIGGRKYDGIIPVFSKSEIVDKASIDSGWFNLEIIGDNLTWEKLIPTYSEEGSTSVQLRLNIESVLSRYLEELKHKAQHYDFLVSGCPTWFNPEVGDQVSIQLLPHENLHKNKKWMGLALCASFVVDKHTLKEDYQGSCRLDRGRSHSVGFDMPLDLRPFMMPGTHQLLVFYIPRAMIPELFIQTTSEQICTSYKTGSSGVRVQICGLRILYQQDLLGFVQTITHCIFCCSGAPSEVYNKLMVEDWINLIRLPSYKVYTSREGDYSNQKENYFQSIYQNYRNQD